MGEKTRKIAIAKNVHWDPHDERAPGLRFDAWMNESCYCRAIIPPEQVMKYFIAYELITPEGLQFADLEGKPVWVEGDELVSNLVGPCVI